MNIGHSSAEARRQITVGEGSCCPLGATWIAARQAYNFALYSRWADSVNLLLFRDRNDTAPVLTVRLIHPGHKTGRVWHCLLPENCLDGARYYAYQVDGPSGPGHRFDPGKILLDPYSRAVVFPNGFCRACASLPGSTAGRAPLGVLGLDRAPFDWSGDRLPRHGADFVIYEMHVRGFTRHPSSTVTPAHQGTFRGVIEKISSLQQLGVTAVELQPVFQYDPDERNYWGYMPLSFFAVHEGYAATREPVEQLNEFREMVKRLHAAGIEVILDVVYNHTAEGCEDGPTYSYRGIDNSSYYLFEADGYHYRNDSATGNVLNTAHPAVRKLILDSLRYWVTEMHVDGFRFDLASIFTRNADGSLNLDDPPIIAEITSDPALMHRRLIAEAWDPVVYQLGWHFPGITWQQWNGRFRDDVRSFVRSDNGFVNALMARLYGSDDLFPDTLQDAYRPFQSVNYVTSHDGFCLYDLVAYNEKHNSANGHDSRDGVNDNRSWNCGWEGDLGAPPEVLSLRQRQVKNFCCLLLLAHGTPMWVAGDEFLNTQRGNNNPYNQDNETTWLDWTRQESNAEFHRYFRLMLGFRQHHLQLGSSRFWRDRITWYGIEGEPDRSYTSHTLAFRLSEGEGRYLYVMINAHWEHLCFHIPNNVRWRRVVDTAAPSPQDICDDPAGEDIYEDSKTYSVRARSIVVLVGTSGNSPGG
ncbi:MAG: isoamylase [Acidobacteriota bacterium]